MLVPTRYSTSTSTESGSTNRTFSGTYTSSSFDTSFSTSVSEGTHTYTRTYSYFGMLNVSATFSNGGRLNSWSYNNNKLTLNYTADADGTMTVSFLRFANAPTCSVLVTLSSNYTITALSYVSGDQPDSTWIDPQTPNQCRCIWVADSLGYIGVSRSATMRITYTYRSTTTTGPYADVYFNGTRINYVYLNGNRYPPR